MKVITSLFGASLALVLLGANIVTPEKLGGEKRILAYLSTDKPIYRGGENVCLRAVALQADSNLPVREHGSAQFTVTGPRGDKVFERNSPLQDSTAGILWTIPSGTPGGVYTATTRINGSAPAERKFEVRSYTPPRLRSQIEFFRKGYSPGEEVTATLQVTRAEGGIPEGAKVNVSATVDGNEFFQASDLTVDKDGLCSVTFKLPEKLAGADGSLVFSVADGGVVENAGKTIPILLNNFTIDFYPEGGDLIGGLENRVYFQARRADGKPADVAGKVFFGDKEVALLKTQHEGRGAFTFKPQAGAQYRLILTEPEGIAGEYPLPQVKPSGTVLKSLKTVYRYDDPLTVEIATSEASNAATVKLFKRAAELSSAPLESGKTNRVTLDPKDAEGVLILTVFDRQGTPVAERLVYRAPKFAVKIKITPQSEAFIPGGKVKLKIETTDEKDSPVEATVGLQVVDDAVLQMIDRREQAPSLPVMVYLENETLDLADAAIYLDQQNPQADTAVDLLLGTQGWRRFILVNYDEIAAKTEWASAAKRALAFMEPAMLLLRERAVPAAAVFMDAKAAPVPPNTPQPQVLARNQANYGNILFHDGNVNEFQANEQLDKRRKELIAPVRRVTVREYAHKNRPDRRSNERTDFRETLYWNAGIRTNPRNGTAEVEFDLSDSVTTFRVSADAFANNGALGAAEAEIKSVEPFYIAPKMPVSVVAGDRIELSVALVNATAEALDATLLVRCEPELNNPIPSGTYKLAAGERGRALVEFQPPRPGIYRLTFTASASGYTDKIERTLIVNPRGFPMNIMAGGLIGPGKDYSLSVDIPAEIEPGSMKTSVKIYPSPLASMEEALNALLRKPYGCFEQTSSTSYPLVMAQQYFLSHQGVSPDKIKKSAELLEEGYKKLIGFESKNFGYEWFGGDPGHEALTAYGLMQFTEMSNIMDVDWKMIERTRSWLLERRDGRGSFKRNERSLDSFGRAPQPTTDAYIVWTLLESGTDPAALSKEIAAVKESAFKTDDSYLVALAANILYLSKDLPAAGQLSEKLVAKMDKNGMVSDGQKTITNSGGSALNIETTSLSIIAWLRLGEKYAAAVEHSMKWLFETCKSGGFGSTQSTILALKAINAYDKARSKPKAPGSVQLVIDGKAFGHPVKFDHTTQGAIELPDFAAALTAGQHIVTLKMTDGSEMPFSLEVHYSTPRPNNSPECALTLKAELDKSHYLEGSAAVLTVTVKAKENVSMPLAVIGIPAGFEVRHDQLKELMKENRISSYETLGNNVILYWREMAKDATKTVPLSMIATYPGQTQGISSYGYLFYTDEYQYYAPPAAAEIKPR